MEAARDLRDDDTPPPSGVRRSVPDALALRPRRSAERDVLAEVAEQVFFEVYGLVRALSPLQGAWLRLGFGQLGGAVSTMATWQGARCQRPARVLRERWPELVPGHAAMTRLASVMVDALC